MKIKNIELTNFKAFGQTVTIPIKPITLIFGANSTGKSSILQFLAMLAQSVTREGLEKGYLFGKGPLVDAGNYRDFIHQHDIAKPFECKFNFDMDVDKLFDINEFLHYNDMFTSFRSLNNSAEKLKKTLATFREIALSFCFHYDTAVKTVNLERVDFFLGGTPKSVFSYLPSSCKLQPNTDHIYWETYWNMFRNEIYERLYDSLECYAKERALSPDELSSLPEQTISQIKDKNSKALEIRALLRLRDNYKALIEINCLLSPEEPFYQQLREEAQHGQSEFELVFRMYNYQFSSFETEGSTNHYLTEFSGFLPSRFDYLKPEEFLCLEFIRDMHNGGDIDLFNPEQLVVLVAWHVKSFLDSFSFIGPLRKRPERFYVEEDTSKDSGNGGDAFRRLAYDDALVRRVNLELDRLQTGYQIKVVHLTDQDGGGSSVFLLQFINQKTGVVASIKDVGFGFSQILPVIVQSQLSFYGTVTIEQPELHLHPALQAELGDMFIRGAFEAEKGESGYEHQKHNRFLIETHSEHLILRLLRRVRETTDSELPDNVPPITPDDIAVLYVQPGPNGSEIIHIPVTKDGEFACPWPGGFFSERAKELF